MKQYIDKSALAAEIEKRIKEVSQIEKASYEIGLCDAYKIVLHFLNTFDVKEVDLEKEIEEIKHIYKVDDNRHTSICSADIEWLAEHFYELGLKAQKGE